MISLFPLSLDDKGFFVLGSKLGLIALVTFSTHVVVSAFFGFDEGKKVLQKIKSIAYRTIKI